jgi:hypothetical protein
MTGSIETYFSASLTPDQRDLAEQSIATMVERTRAEVEAARARLAEEDMLLDAIKAPIAKLMRADPEAAEALEKFSRRRVELEESLSPEDPHGEARDLVPVAVELRSPPYDFAWRFHLPDGAPPFAQIGDKQGRLGLDARSGGLIQGGAGRFVKAHIGVGCLVRVERPLVIEVSATHSERHSFLVGAPAIGSSATSEGGLDSTIFRGSEFVMGGSIPLWRRRVSGPNEEARGRTNFTRRVFPDRMGGRRDPGEYVFNVGIWAFADHRSGLGGAGAQSLIQSNILEMRIDRRG